MELKVEIGFDELLHAVQQLPEDKRAILKDEPRITNTIMTSSKKKKLADDNLTDFKKMLLTGPIMSDKEHENFKDISNSIIGEQSDSIRHVGFN